MSARTLVLSALLIAATGAAWAQEPTTSDPLAAPTCVPSEGNGLFTANLPADTVWAQTRLYFRKAGEADFYFLEMQSDAPGSYWAALPEPSAGTTAVDAHLLATSADGLQVSGGPVTVPVMSNCLTSLTPEQQAFADNLIVGETAPAQRNESLIGWECDGVIMRMDLGGALRPDDVCRKVMMASAAEEAGLAATRSSLLLPVLGGAVGGAVIGYYVGDDNQDPCADCPVSPVFP